MTKTLAIAADLGIAQALSDGPRPVAELARESGVDRDALHRVLRGLASDGVFVEEEDGVFENNPTSQLLLGTGWSEFAHLFGDVFYRAVSDLDEAVRTGAPTFARTFGTDFWQWLAAHPPDRAVFDRAMSGGKNRSAERLAGLDWDAGEIVVDVGGGNGTLLSELLRRRPELRGVVLDLPETDRDEDARDRTSSSSREASSSASPRATRTSSRGSSTTGVTGRRPRSSAPSVRPRGRMRASSSRRASSHPGTSQRARSGSIS